MSKAKTLADLKASGLTLADYKKLGIYQVTPEQNKKLTNEKFGNAPGYVIPYFDIHGKPVKGLHCKQIFRRRNLEIPKGPRGGVLDVKPGKWRYSGPPDELPHLFFPANFGNWPAQAKDVTEPIYITEGEKKAACMCKNGFATIAVPGVWGWRSKKHNIDVIDDFDCIDWGDADNPRAVYMVFDNDIIVKADVLHALTALARQLTNKGAEVFVKYLPDGPLKGADDFIVANGADAFDELPEEQFSENETLFRMNERLAFIDTSSFVYDLDTARNYNSKQRLEFQFADEFVLRPNAAGDLVPKLAVIEWLKWPKKRKYRKLTYSPGKDTVIGPDLNTWPGWGCAPAEGDVTPFLDLMNFLFKDEHDVRDWFIQWLAFPLQNPGVKMAHAVLLWSAETGMGKSRTGAIMRKIYGDNYSEVTKDELTSQFNQWRINKQFILGEEITGSDSKREADKVKGLITAESFIANEKHQGTFQIESRENYLLTSNHANAIFMENNDRRYLIHHIEGKPAPRPFYDRISEWKDSKDGPPALFHYLLNVDMAGFHPFGDVPFTAAKQQMIEDSKSTWEMALEDFIGNIDAYTEKLGIERDVFTVAEILSLTNQPAYLANALSRIITKKRLPRCKVARSGFSKRLIAVRNPSQWQDKAPQEWHDNYIKDFKDPIDKVRNPRKRKVKKK